MWGSKIWGLNGLEPKYQRGLVRHFKLCSSQGKGNVIKTKPGADLSSNKKQKVGWKKINISLKDPIFCGIHWNV